MHLPPHWQDILAEPLMTPSIGHGIINADGELWKIQRKAGLRFFSNAQLKALVDDVLPVFIENTKKTLDVAAQTSAQVDLQEIFSEFTTRVMGKVAYDVSGPSLTSLIGLRQADREIWH